MSALALRADAEKIEAVAGDGKTGLPRQFLGHIRQGRYIRIEDFPANRTYHVGMVVGFVAVVAVAVIAETQFQQLIEVSEDSHIFVNGGQAGGGKAGLDLFVD